MKQKIVGIYEMGYMAIELVAREGTGGEYYTIPEHGHIPRIKLGMDHTQWRDVVDVLLHETLEFAIDTKNGRLRPTYDTTLGHDNFVFLLTHPQFSDMCAKVAEFITTALPDLAAVWKKWKKRSKS